MRNKLIVLLLCLCVAPVFGQEVVFNISPRNAFVRINGEVLDLSRQNKIQLASGTYQAEIWAPNFEVVTKTIVVEAGKNQGVNFGLKKQAQTFLDYREELSEFKTAKLKRSLSGGTLVAANAVLSYLMFIDLYSKGRKVEDEIVKLQELYDNNTAFIGFASIQDAYSRALADHSDIKERQETRIKTGIPIVGALTAATAYLFYRRATDKKLKRPEYVSDNPFVSVLKRTEPLIVVTSHHNSIGFSLKF